MEVVRECFSDLHSRRPRLLLTRQGEDCDLKVIYEEFWMICDLAGSRTSTWKHTASRRKSSGHGNGTWRRTWTSWCGAYRRIRGVDHNLVDFCASPKMERLLWQASQSRWVPRGRNIAEETRCTVAFSGCQLSPMSAVSTICNVERTMDSACCSNFFKKRKRLQSSELLHTCIYLRNLQQAAQADSLSNATWLIFKAVARTPKWPSATLGDRCFFA